MLKKYIRALTLLKLRHWPITLKRFLVQKIMKYPKVIAIEPSSWCNLNCAFCVTKEIKVWESRRKKMLTFAEFKKLVDETKHFCYRMDFAFCGEPLMNPEVYKMVEYASSKGILTQLCTNATFLIKDNADKILDSGLHRIFIAFESVKKEVHEQTKIGSDYETVKNNIKYLAEEKKRRKLKVPRIITRMVLTKKNENDIEEYLKQAKKLGADRAGIKPLGVWPQGGKEYREKMFSELITDHPISRYKKDEHGNWQRLPKDCACPSISTPVITSGGTVVLCWYDALKESAVGNINEDTFTNIWKKSKPIRDKMAKGDYLSICKECLGHGAPGQIIDLE
jgi:radical SAM protein with 4Fe4S-binding SPASM domain